MLIDTLTGQQNFAGSSAKAYVFAVPTRQHVGFKEMHLFEAVRSSAGVAKHAGGGRVSAVEGLGSEFGGFTQTQFNIPDGMVLKLFASRKRRGAQLTDSASQFVRARAGAALLRLEVGLNDWPGRQCTVTRAYLEGRFDLMTLEEAEELGASVSPIHRRHFTPGVVANLITNVTLSQQISAPVVVEKQIVRNSEGEHVSIASRQSRRMLDV